jgi:hypothetical protein
MPPTGDCSPIHIMLRATMAFLRRTNWPAPISCRGRLCMTSLGRILRGCRLGQDGRAPAVRRASKRRRPQRVILPACPSSRTSSAITAIWVMPARARTFRASGTGMRFAFLLRARLGTKSRFALCANSPMRLRRTEHWFMISRPMAGRMRPARHARQQTMRASEGSQPVISALIAPVKVALPPSDTCL